MYIHRYYNLRTGQIIWQFKFFNLTTLNRTSQNRHDKKTLAHLRSTTLLRVQIINHHIEYL